MLIIKMNCPMILTATAMTDDILKTIAIPWRNFVLTKLTEYGIMGLFLIVHNIVVYLAITQLW